MSEAEVEKDEEACGASVRCPSLPSHLVCTLRIGRMGRRRPPPYRVRPIPIRSTPRPLVSSSRRKSRTSEDRRLPTRRTLSRTTTTSPTARLPPPMLPRTRLLSADPLRSSVPSCRPTQALTRVATRASLRRVSSADLSGPRSLSTSLLRARRARRVKGAAAPRRRNPLERPHPPKRIRPTRLLPTPLTSMRCRL